MNLQKTYLRKMIMSTKKKKIEKEDSIAANTNSTITFYPEPVTNQLFPTPLLFAKLPRKYTDEEVAFVQKCSLNVTKNTGNTTSVDRYIFEEPAMAGLKSFVQFYINYYMNEIECPFNPVEAYITQSWLNYTQPGEYHHKHEHPNSYLSGVLYINADPEKDKTATKYSQISFDEVYSKGLNVMDLTAFTLCKENNLPIIVFDMDTVGNLKKLMSGEKVGTIVCN